MVQVFVFKDEKQKTFSGLLMLNSPDLKIGGRVNAHHSGLFLWNYTFIFSLFLFTFVGLSACNETFEPLSDSSSSPVSIYGFLDASADTQWIRITPIREQVDMPPIKPDMEVTLKHLESGNSVFLNDTLISMRGGVNVLNAWTIMDIKHGQTYTIEGKRSDGAVTKVKVTIPEQELTAEIIESGNGCRATLRVDGVEQLADIHTRLHIRAMYAIGSSVMEVDERYFSIPYKRKAIRLAQGNYMVPFNTDDEMNYISSQFSVSPNIIQVLSRNIFVASAGPEWIDISDSVSEIIHTLPESYSNVENGLGYLVGITSKTIPWMKCFE